MLHEIMGVSKILSSLITNLTAIHPTQIIADQFLFNLLKLLPFQWKANCVTDFSPVPEKPFFLSLHILSAMLFSSTFEESFSVTVKYCTVMLNHGFIWQDSNSLSLSFVYSYKTDLNAIMFPVVGIFLEMIMLFFLKTSKITKHWNKLERNLSNCPCLCFFRNNRLVKTD